MTTSLRAFLEGLIDYAGLFPPAKLPMEEAVAQFADHLQSPESWMLSRFICPAGRLAEFADAAAGRFAGPVSISVLAGGGADGTAYMENLKSDLAAIRAFADVHGEHHPIDVAELKLPADLMTGDESRDVREILNATSALLESRFPGQTVTPFVELGPVPNWTRAVRYLVRFLDYNNAAPAYARRRRKVRPMGFKLRCGGVTADAFPSVETVATAIAICHNQDVTMKLTAGLHHPVRHFNEALQVKMHGFLNVGGAILFARAQALTAEELAPILEEEDAAAFHFEDGKFTWRDRFLTAEQVAAGRRDGVVSYGSCSFDEPREDLAALGLLELQAR